MKTCNTQPVTCNRQKKLLHEDGFTLIEIVVVVMLVTVASIVLVNMFISQNRIYRSQNAELNVTSSVRSALDDIDNYVRQANTTLSSYNTYTAGPQVLILQVQSINAQNRLISGTYDYIVYYLDNGNLTRVITANAASSRSGGAKVVGGNVSALAFTYDNADFSQVTEVTTNITASESAGNQVRSFNSETKSSLRNFR